MSSFIQLGYNKSPNQLVQGHTQVKLMYNAGQRCSGEMQGRNRLCTAAADLACSCTWAVLVGVQMTTEDLCVHALQCFHHCHRHQHYQCFRLQCSLLMQCSAE